MLDSLTYATDVMPVNWEAVPLRGRYLCRSLDSKAKAAFVGADLYRGTSRLIEPSLAQAAFITGSDVTAVWWALRREEYRSEICRRLMPLMPARPKKNGKALSVPMVDDAEIINFVRNVGIGRVLDAACAVEAAE